MWGDVELAWRLRERKGRKTADWLTITGTNGKTTTVGLTASMLQAAGPEGHCRRQRRHAHPGRPPGPGGLRRLRGGALQLPAALERLRCRRVASVCLNVAEDHVDWHGSYASYLADKAKIYEHTQKACIYNAEQIETERMVEDADVVEGCRAVGFTTHRRPISMLGVVEGLLVDRAFIAERKDSAAELASIADLGAAGPAPTWWPTPSRRPPWSGPTAWNRQRCARGCRTTFRGPPHPARGPPNGVLWVNDSKATNPHAAAAVAVRVRERGLDRRRTVQGRQLRRPGPGPCPRLKAVVLIGTDSARCTAALQRHAPDVPVIGRGEGRH